MKNHPSKHNSRRKNPQPTKEKTGETSAKPPTNLPSRKPSVVPQPYAVAASSSQTVIPNPTAVRPESMPVISTTPPITTAVATTERIEEPNPEQIMQVFLQNFGRGAKASAIYAGLAETITSAPAPVLPHAEEAGSPRKKKMEEAEGDDKEEKKGNQGTEGGKNEERVSEGESEERVEDEEPEGNEGNDGDEGDNAEGTGEGREREEVDEEDVAVENEEDIVGEHDGENVENEEPVDESVNEPESEGLKEIVDLEDGPDGEETPVDERTTRRNIRRSRQVDELVAATRPMKLQFGTSEGEVQTWEDIPEALETPEKEEEVSPEAVEKRFAAERKRKEKQEAKPLTKKHGQASCTVEINEPTPEPICVPFAKPLEGPNEDSEEEEEADVNPPEQSIYEIIEVLVTRKLLEAMAHFDYHKKALTYGSEGRMRN
ncbi:high mobility group nucleosome-binding domain-containing protein 5-like [Salvia splendens]|uniref:high mobility group nucleosome-binding domain-containing protein 5-like n=1 Tax=Salvia splendens TaxID=180675 RepID=UPI001C277205|nr:high mobility group nucleosome-binding domain-containing protein 5-like [Salvia splendens]